MARAHLAVVALVFCGCEAHRNESPPRSSRDYDVPTPTTSADGEVMGADRQRPTDTLSTGPRIGSDGITPAKRPASVKPEHEEREHKRERLCRDSAELSSGKGCPEKQDEAPAR